MLLEWISLSLGLFWSLIFLAMIFLEHEDNYGFPIKPFVAALIHFIIYFILI